jgi:hypothetical protein
MEKQDAEGAAAAAEYFLSLRAYIMKTGDTAEWEAMSHEACDFCTSSREQARQIAERGDVFEGGEITARTVQQYDRDSVTGIWPLDVEMNEAATHILDAQGNVLLEAEASVEVNRVEMGIRDGAWVVVTVASVPEE